MPQMKPLLWVYLMLTSILIMLTMMSLIYFTPLDLSKTLYHKQNLSSKFKMLTWTW